MASPSNGRVLVTGLGGFTGTHLGPLLQQRGYDIVGGSEPQFDLTQPETIAATIDAAQPDYVIHFAGISFVAHDDAAALYSTNTVGTTALLRALEPHASRLRKIILASTSQVYGNATDHLISEQTPAAPISHYACSKLAMEMMARTWFDKLPIVITRPFNYVGRGQAQQFLLPKLVDHFRRRAPVIELGNVDVEREFQDVRSVADVYVRLLQAPVQGAVLNIASGIGRTLRSIVELAGTITGHSVRIQINPAFVRSNEVARLVGSNQRLREAIGEWQQFDFEQTLRWMLQSN